MLCGGSADLTSEEAKTSGKSRGWLVRAKRVFAVLATGCLLYFGWHSREMLGEIIASASPGILALAVGSWLLLHLLSPLFVALVFRGSGLDLHYRQVLRIHLENLPARYIPGGIWHTVGRVLAFRKLGVDAHRISLFVLLENVISAAVAFLLGGGLLFHFHGPDSWGGLAVVSAIISGLVILHFPILLHFWLSGRNIKMSTGHYIGGIFVVCLVWCAASAAFVLFVSSFAGLSLEISLLETAAAYLFSWGVGFLAVFAPQGIGVFEVTAGQLLRGTTALGGVAVLLAGFRAVIFIADLLAWVLGRLLLSRDTG